MTKDRERDILMDTQFPYGSLKYPNASKSCHSSDTDGVDDEIESESNEFSPSSSRFVVAFLICLSSALNCFIQYTFVSIWYVIVLKCKPHSQKL